MRSNVLGLEQISPKENLESEGPVLNSQGCEEDLKSGVLGLEQNYLGLDGDLKSETLCLERNSQGLDEDLKSDVACLEKNFPGLDEDLKYYSGGLE